MNRINLIITFFLISTASMSANSSIQINPNSTTPDFFIGSEFGYVHNTKLLTPSSATEKKLINPDSPLAIRVNTGLIYSTGRRFDYMLYISSGWYNSYSNIYNGNTSRHDKLDIFGFEALIGPRWHLMDLKAKSIYISALAGFFISKIGNFSNEASLNTASSFNVQMLDVAPAGRIEAGFLWKVFEVNLSYMYVPNLYKSGKGNYFTEIRPNSHMLFIGTKYKFDY